MLLVLLIFALLSLFALCCSNNIICINEEKISDASCYFFAFITITLGVLGLIFYINSFSPSAKENEITECEKEIIKLKTQYINSNNTNNEEKIQEIEYFIKKYNQKVEEYNKIIEKDQERDTLLKLYPYNKKKSLYNDKTDIEYLQSVEND